jgi:hypothetical protein
VTEYPLLSPFHARMVLVVACTSLVRDTVNSNLLPPDVLEDVCTGDDFGGAGLDLGELIVVFA